LLVRWQVSRAFRISGADADPPRTIVSEQTWSHSSVTAEQRLALLLCGTPEVRDARQEQVRALADATDWLTMYSLLARLNVITLIGHRLRELQIALPPRVEEQIVAQTARAEERGQLHELVSLTLLAELERSGIRSMPLKGSSLAGWLYRDRALRFSADIDLLVAPRDLARSVEVAGRMGWVPDRRAIADDLPLLHESLTHPELPRLELHWRVHWYESRFASDALARAIAGGPGEPMRMQPDDELAGLILFYVRDGFTGLRTPADIASWPTALGREDAIRDDLASVAARHPKLVTALGAGADVLAGLVGIPLAGAVPTTRAAAVTRRLANPFLLGDRVQMNADASFIDVLLAPRGARWASARRELRNVPPDSQSIAAGAAWRRWAGQAGHTVRTTGRWLVSAAKASGLSRARAVQSLRTRLIAGRLLRQTHERAS
jgi:hypothetical protein